MVLPMTREHNTHSDDGSNVTGTLYVSQLEWLNKAIVLKRATGRVWI